MNRVFTKEEVKRFIRTDEIYREIGEKRGWARDILSIVNMNNKFYRLNWKQGIGEDQDDLYEEQVSDEMEKIIVEGWRKKE